MNKITYICCECGNVMFFPEEHKFKGKDKCPKCGNGCLPANTRQLPVVTQEQYSEMIQNNTWDDYLIKNLSILPYVRKLKEQKALESQPPQQFTPKCPTCGCTDIRRISATEKAVNIGMFGLFGNKRRYQFECLNPACKYKW